MEEWWFEDYKVLWSIKSIKIWKKMIDKRVKSKTLVIYWFIPERSIIGPIFCLRQDSRVV